MSDVRLSAATDDQRLPAIADLRRSRSTTILSVDGELQELDRNKRPIENPVEVYGQFKWIGQQRNYKPGWAYHKAAEYLNCKPVGFDAAPLCPPSQTILRWEKSRRIAFAKGRAKGLLTSLSSTVPIGGIYQSKDPETFRSSFNKTEK